MAKPMAKRKKPNRIVVELPDQEEATSADQEPEKLDPDIEEVIDQVPLEARVEVWRWGSPDAPDEWCYLGRLPVQGFNLDVLASRYGPGKYRVRVRGPKLDEITGRSRMVQFAVRHVTIDSASSARGSRENDTRQSLGMSLAEMMQFNLQALQALVAARPDPAQFLQSIVQLVKPESDPVKLALQMVQLMKDKGGSVKEVLEVLQMGMDLGEKVAAPQDGLGSFAKALAEFVDRMPGRERQLPSAPAQPPQQPTPPQDQVALAGGTGANPDVLEFFSLARSTLKRAAARDSDPELYAEWLLDQMPQGLEPYLGIWLNDTSFPANLIPYFGDDVPPEFLRVVLLKMKELVSAQEDEGIDKE